MDHRGSGSGLLAPRPGEHICAFYRGPTERDRLMAAYLDDSARSGDACLCAADGRMMSTLGGSALTTVDLGAPRPQPRTVLAATGPVLRRIREWAHATFERERRPGGRVVTDMGWALPARPSVEDLADYEAEVTAGARRYPQSVVCLYDLDRCTTVVHAVIRAHSRVWMRGVVLENPYSSGIGGRRRPASPVDDR